MNPPPARTSKALAAWTELNDRQQGTLAVIYELDQQAGTRYLTGICGLGWP